MLVFVLDILYTILKKQFLFPMCSFFFRMQTLKSLPLTSTRSIGKKVKYRFLPLLASLAAAAVVVAAADDAAVVDAALLLIVFLVLAQVGEGESERETLF